MTDENTTEPTEPTEPTPPAPEEPAERSVVVQLDFRSTDPNTPSTPYAASIKQVENLTAEQYAKAVAETVERTVLLHLGVLPVLSRVEVAP